MHIASLTVAAGLDISMTQPPARLTRYDHAGCLLDCSFRLGRQEDAHEYLVALLDAMHESYISMCRPKPSPELSQTSMIYRIFAGRIRSQVQLQ